MKNKKGLKQIKKIQLIEQKQLRTVKGGNPIIVDIIGF